MCSAEELSDARLLPREQVLAAVERLVLDLLCSINAGTDPELLMVTASCNRSSARDARRIVLLCRSVVARRTWSGTLKVTCTWGRKGQ